MNYLFITGTSRGIGKAIAEAALQTNEFNVYGIGRSQSIEHTNYSHTILDLGDEWDIVNFDFPVLEDATSITLVNNSATLGEVRHNGNLNDEILLNAYIVNLAAPASLCNKFMKRYRSYHCRKLIVNISTGAAFNAYDGWSIYCATKAGLEMLSNVLHTEELVRKDDYPFIVKSAAPGVVATSMQDQLRSSDPEEFSRKSKFVDLYEEGKLLDPSEIASRYLTLITNPDKFPGLSHRLG